MIVLGWLSCNSDDSKVFVSLDEVGHGAEKAKIERD